MHHELEVVDDDVSDIVDVASVRHDVDRLLQRHRSVEAEKGHRKLLERIRKLVEPIQVLGQVNSRILSTKILFSYTQCRDAETYGSTSKERRATKNLCAF